MTVNWRRATLPVANMACPQCSTGKAALDPPSESGAESPSSNGVTYPRNNLFYTLNLWLQRDPQSCSEALGFITVSGQSAKYFSHGDRSIHCCWLMRGRNGGTWSQTNLSSKSTQPLINCEVLSTRGSEQPSPRCAGLAYYLFELKFALF